MTDDEILCLVQKVLEDHSTECSVEWNSPIAECRCGHPGGAEHQTQMLADSGILRLTIDEPREAVDRDATWLRVPTSIGQQFAEQILAEVDRDTP